LVIKVEERRRATRCGQAPPPAARPVGAREPSFRDRGIALIFLKQPSRQEGRPRLAA